MYISIEIIKKIVSRFKGHVTFGSYCGNIAYTLSIQIDNQNQKETHANDTILCTIFIERYI